jgi:polysaccharide biosynthesis protein PslH
MAQIGEQQVMQRVLWITARLPYPLRSGDALYTAGLLQAARVAGMQVTVVGLTREPDVQVDRLREVENIDWRPIQAVPRSVFGSLFSSLPKDAYILLSRELREEIGRLTRDDWDWVVFDHARSAGALDLVAARRGTRIAYVAHNVERKVRREVAAGMNGGIKRAPYILDAEKYARLEDKLVATADAVIAITDEDAAEFRKAGARAVRVPPVYRGPRIRRRLDDSVPRRVMLLGSFDWIAKQSNLVQFLQVVGTRLAAAGVGVDIVGSIPSDLRNRLASAHGGVCFHGPVADVTPIAASARCGVIPEELGGGMKLKTLDYIFLGLPIFTLESGMAGLPDAVRSTLFTAGTLPALADFLLRQIDEVAELDVRQATAFAACDKLFSVEAAASALGRALQVREQQPMSTMA